MSNVVPFPTSRRVMAKAIPREEFEQLALDVVERIVALLDDQDRGPAAQAGDWVSSPTISTACKSRPVMLELKRSDKPDTDDV